MPITIRCSAEMARALDSPLDDDLKALLRHRRDQLLDGFDDYDLGELTHFTVATASDTAASIEAALGFDPTVNLVDGSRLGDPDFTPSWEWIERHAGWVEIAFVLTDDGFGHVLLIPDDADIDPTLLALCRADA